MTLGCGRQAGTLTQLSKHGRCHCTSCCRSCQLGEGSSTVHRIMTAGISVHGKIRTWRASRSECIAILCTGCAWLIEIGTWRAGGCECINILSDAGLRCRGNWNFAGKAAFEDPACVEDAYVDDVLHADGHSGMDGLAVSATTSQQQVTRSYQFLCWVGKYYNLYRREGHPLY